MAIHAYDRNYLYLAQNQLAWFLDYSVNFLNLSLSFVWESFLKSDLSHKFANGDSSILSGKSGIELALDLFNKNGDDYPDYISIDRSREYWLGYYLAYYQWEVAISFDFLNKYISIEEMLSLYNPYHEMDIHQFIDKLNEILNQRKEKTNLEIFRHKLGLSRRELSIASNVPYRLIEHYEQRMVDINKASSEYVISLAKALYVNPQDLLEIK